MKGKIFLFVLLIGNLFTYGQNKDFHIVELLPNKTETVENVDFYISEIFDNRIYKNNIGVAQKGPFNKKVLANFDNSLNEELMNYFETVFPKDETKTPLIVRVNRLLIFENTGAFKETGKAITSVDILVKLDDGYGLIGSFSAMQEKNSVDVTAKHDDRIRGILKECLMLFNSTNWRVVEPILIDLEKKGQSKVLVENYKEGFYYSLLELYNNKTIIDRAYSVDERKSNGDKLFLKSDEQGKAMYFAYSDGDDLYLNAAIYSADRHYIKTYKFDEFVLFNDVFVNDDKVMGWSYALGLLGQLVSTENQNVLMDLNTGEIFTLSKKKMKLILGKKYPKLLKQYYNNSKDVNEVLNILNYVLENENKEELRGLLRA